jgi:hypothetical protein
MKRKSFFKNNFTFLKLRNCRRVEASTEKSVRDTLCSFLQKDLNEILQDRVRKLN